MVVFPHLCSFAGGYPLKIVVVRYLYYFIFIIANCETTKGNAPWPTKSTWIWALGLRLGHDALQLGFWGDPLLETPQAYDSRKLLKDVQGILDQQGHKMFAQSPREECGLVRSPSSWLFRCEPTTIHDTTKVVTESRVSMAFGGECVCCLFPHFLDERV